MPWHAEWNLDLFGDNVIVYALIVCFDEIWFQLIN